MINRLLDQLITDTVNKNLNFTFDLLTKNVAKTTWIKPFNHILIEEEKTFISVKLNTKWHIMNYWLKPLKTWRHYWSTGLPDPRRRWIRPTSFWSRTCSRGTCRTPPSGPSWRRTTPGPGPGAFETRRNVDLKLISTPYFEATWYLKARLFYKARTTFPYL